MPRVDLRCVMLVFPDHTHMIFLLYVNRHQGYKTFSCSTHLSKIFGIFIIIEIEINEPIFLLRTVDHTICPGHKFKMPTIVGILKFKTRTNKMLM